MTKLNRMRAHVQDLADQHGVEIRSHSRGGSARSYRDGRRVIAIRPILTTVTYAVALHELGHLLDGGRKNRTRLEHEGDAWQWALDNAIEWSVAAQRRMETSLRRYAMWAHAKHERGVRNAPVFPPAGHPFWVLQGMDESDVLAALSW